MTERVSFRADRPFLALVIHKPTGIQVVSALIDNPAET